MTLDTDTHASINDLLSSIDDVLAANVPAAAVVPAPAAPVDVVAEEPAPAAPVDDFDEQHDATRDTAPITADRKPDWWQVVYADQDADQDTFTGNVPAAAPVPAPPNVPASDEDDDLYDGDFLRKQPPLVVPAPPNYPPYMPPAPPAVVVDEQDDQDGEPGKKGKGGKAKDGGGFLTPLGVHIVYLGSAAAAGKALTLYDVLAHAAAIAPDHVAPVTAGALIVGIAAPVLRVPRAAMIFFGSLGVVGLTGMVDAGWGLALTVPALLWLLDTQYRKWLHRGGPPHQIWRYVTWAARIPLATSLAVLIFHATN